MPTDWMKISWEVLRWLEGAGPDHRNYCRGLQVARIALELGEADGASTYELVNARASLRLLSDELWIIAEPRQV